MQKRLLAIKPAQLVTWLNNLENTGQITEQESKDLLTLAEQVDIYNLPFTECTFLLLRTNLYLHPSMLSLLMLFVGYVQDLYSAAVSVLQYQPVIDDLAASLIA